MSKTKLEEVFNLPPMDDIDGDIDEIIIVDDTQEIEDEIPSIEDMKHALSEADKIDKALAPVKDIASLDKDMDEYADKAMDSFSDLMDLGQNVEDRHCADVFNAAAKMMKNAIDAKATKLDRKLKVIQLQLQKEKMDLENRKLDHKISSDNKAPSETALKGEGEVIMDRNELLKQILESHTNPKQ